MEFNDFDLFLIRLLLAGILTALLSWIYRKGELKLSLMRVPKRSGSSALYPFNYPHIFIDKGVVDSFEWLKPEDILLHEEYIEGNYYEQHKMNTSLGYTLKHSLFETN